MNGNQITTRVAATLLGVAQRSVVRYILQGRIAATRVWEPDGPYLLDRADVLALAPQVAEDRRRRHVGLSRTSA
ncbi:MAG: hypothetical protein ACRD0W_12535 [Acidimicrobiales bacterium]